MIRELNSGFIVVTVARLCGQIHACVVPAREIITCEIDWAIFCGERGTTRLHCMCLCQVLCRIQADRQTESTVNQHVLLIVEHKSQLQLPCFFFLPKPREEFPPAAAVDENHTEA